VSLCEALEVALVEELDLHVGIALAELAELAVLPRHERLLHDGHLEVEVLLRQEEVGREGLQDAAVLILREDERARLVLPGDPVEVEDLRALEFRLVLEVGWLRPAIRLENGVFHHHFGEDTSGFGRRNRGEQERSARRWHGFDSFRRRRSSSSSTARRPRTPSRWAACSSSCSPSSPTARTSPSGSRSESTRATGSPTS